MSKQFDRPHFGKVPLTTTVQAIYCMGIISFSETHINYIVTTDPNAPINVPPEGGSEIPIGNKKLLKTQLDSLPISKYLVSKILLCAIICVIKSHLELPEKD